MKSFVINFVFFVFISACNIISAEVDVLPSWNEGQAKNSILQFVKDTTTKESPDYVPPKYRVATFDQDGTLWVEQPLYAQIFFALDNIKSMSADHPEWNEQEPFKSILTGDQQKLKNLGKHELEKIIVATHSGMSVKEFNKRVNNWLEKAVHPKFKKPFTEMIYQPMLEVIQLLRNNGYKIYIVSGGGQEFIRTFAEKTYGIEPEFVIGSTGKVKYECENGQPVLKKIPEVLFVNDKAGKPEAINLIIGRRPYAAFGNSDGDREMLEWCCAGKGKRLALLVHHDDAEREYAYDTDSKIGTFSKGLMDQAKKQNWVVVSMKKDWKVIFPWQVVR